MEHSREWKISGTSITIYQVNSSPNWTWSGGLLLLNKAAFPRIREIESLWNSFWVVLLSSSPVCLANMLPNFFIWTTALGCQKPRHSAARGMKSKCWISPTYSKFDLWERQVHLGFLTPRIYTGVASGVPPQITLQYWLVWRTSMYTRVFLIGHFEKKMSTPPHNLGVPRKIMSRRRGW